ncbi:MAG TPA: VWA domain-containing protein [Polyangiales bacterium]
MRRRLSWLWVASFALVCGCSAGLKLTRIEAAHRKPSNVAVFFSVDDKKGEPVADLLASDFNIYEDQKLVSVDESRQTIVNPEIAAAHYTLLLVDMSASVTASDQVQQIVAAATQFESKLEHYQRVAVYAFDGSKTLYEITPFVPTGQQTAQGLNALTTFRTRDPSTNLNGAVVQALSELDKQLSRSSVPLRFGTLVVFTDGTDRADRVPFQNMVDAVEASPHAIYAIGVGHEIDDSTLSRIGKSGYIRVEDSAALASAFNQIGERIVRFTRRYYLLSYCSPARAGKHQVSIEAVTKKDRGRLDYEFNAAGFGPDCDPNRPPPFDTTGKSRKVRNELLQNNAGDTGEHLKVKAHEKVEATTK